MPSRYHGNCDLFEVLGAAVVYRSLQSLADDFLNGNRMKLGQVIEFSEGILDHLNTISVVAAHILEKGITVVLIFSIDYESHIA